MCDPDLSRRLAEIELDHDRLDRMAGALAEECHLALLLKRAVDFLLEEAEILDGEGFDTVVTPALKAWEQLHGGPF